MILLQHLSVGRQSWQVNSHISLMSMALQCNRFPSLAANYRPISLLSVCYKLLERLALQHISPTVEGLLSPDQAGFRKGRSTCDHVAALTTFIENGFQQNLKTGAVFLDLTAAYDTVWHTGFLYKLSLLLLVCVSFTIIGQPRNSVLIRRV